jgi:methylmalonyl-CoA/ethylmalonyl-CoA epimerase
MLEGWFRFHHVGVVTGDLSQSISLYAALGYRASKTHPDPIQKSEIVLLEREDGPIVELIHPIGADSPANGWLKRIQCGPYHTCYEVPDLENAVKRLRGEGLVAVTEAAPAVAFGMRLVCFLWSRKAGLIELLEARRGTSPPG